MDLVNVFLPVLPVLIVGGIVVYVILSLKQLANEGKLVKKKSKGAQIWVDSLIPLGMVFGSVIGVVLGLFSPFSLSFTLSLGAGIGYLLGFFVYKSYSEKGNNCS